MPPKYAPDCEKRFKQLELHKNPEIEEDDAKRPFVLSAKVKEEHGGQIYGCAFNPYLSPDESQVVATVGLLFLHVYEVPVHSNRLIPLYTCHFPYNEALSAKADRKEWIFCVAWAYDTYEHKMGRNPHRVLCGGALGQIYVIDHATNKLVNRLVGMGGDVNEIRTCPTNSNLIASASADMSVQIYHIRNAQCLVRIGGSKCHDGHVLTVDWHLSGSYLISAGFDHQIMKFDLSGKDVKESLKQACDLLSKGRQNVIEQKPILNRDNQTPEISSFETVFNETVPVSTMNVDENEKETVLDVHRNFSKHFSPVFISISVPSAIAGDIHNNYVDCVRVVPETDYIFSKSCETDRDINLWRFGPPNNQKVNEDDGRYFSVETCTTLFQARETKGVMPFWVKFDLDPWRRWLVCGGHGCVNFYDLGNYKQKDPRFTIGIGNRTIRQASFSPCGRILCTVSDDSFVCRLDRVRESVNQADLKKFID